MAVAFKFAICHECPTGGARKICAPILRNFRKKWWWNTWQIQCTIIAWLTYIRPVPSFHPASLRSTMSCTLCSYRLTVVAPSVIALSRSTQYYPTEVSIQPFYLHTRNLYLLYVDYFVCALVQARPLSRSLSHLPAFITSRYSCLRTLTQFLAWRIMQRST